MAVTNSATVIACYGKQAVISNNLGRDLIKAKIRRGAGKPLCGDIVDWVDAGDNTAYITRIHKRHNQLLRADFRNRAKPLLANIQQLAIVIAPAPGYDLEMIDRALTISRILDIPPTLIINKTDLMDEEQKAELLLLQKRWHSFGITTATVSAKKNTGIADLNALLKNNTTALCGQSGVGKSSLCNVLIPGRDILEGALSEATGLGKHTTTSSTLYHVDESTLVIDTPGTRDFALWEMSHDELLKGFPELFEFANNCRFNNCSHIHEPDCAVVDAKNSGNLDELRYRTYITAVAKQNEN